ncbi:MAG: glycolate oxidase subunit GlcF [Gammaproteobacteria bacterium]|nr:glycolate oxidase subunit GlcF [Gammaproteobacteria bacterium]
METAIVESYLNTPDGREADEILRTCVHCGFCTATCPTYQLLGDELDGPRGRIYLIKQVLEGNEPTHRTQLHLDRCLTCRSCETTCPSGVKYARLVDIGRGILEERVRRPLMQRIVRTALRGLVPHPVRFKALLGLGRLSRPLLPRRLKQKIPHVRVALPRPASEHPRTVLALQGCAQQVVTPNTLASAARILDRLGITLVTESAAGCCGALSYHLAAQTEGLDFMRRNIDAWWPRIEAGVEAILITESGCGAMLKDYGYALRNDPLYSAKARRVTELSRDLSELLHGEDLSCFGKEAPERRIAFHAPCSLQHGQGLNGRVESILGSCGFKLTPVTDAHLCCGSAGTYSVLQPELSDRLLSDKLRNLEGSARSPEEQPETIATANIGCLLHLSSKSERLVKHWIELLDEVCENA